MASERVKLADIRERVEKATPGPWSVEHARVWQGEPVPGATEIAAMLGSRPWVPDAEFIAHARRDVPALLAALDAVLALHVRDDRGSQGWTDSGGYGWITPYCAGCEANDEYAVKWPCPTVRAIETVIDPGGENRG